MNLTFLSELDNKLLQRKEMKIVAEFEGSTPSRSQFKEEICEKFHLPKDLTVIKKIFQEKGKQKAICSVFVYETQEAMKIEPKYISKRDERKAGKQPKQEQPAEEASAQQ